jgi:hypothetical protein
MSELPMRGHFRYLRFKTFPMTPRTPQCEVFCPLLSSSEHSGVPEDSQPPTFPSVGLHPHTWPKWGCDSKSAGQEEARELRHEEARESHHILPGVLESVREYEGVNPHTPKATPTLGSGLPVDSQNFKERLQGSNLNGLGRSLYHEKALET